MRQLGKRMGICLLLAAVCWTVGLVRDRAFLNRELIRLHVVANSDSEEDQAVKLRVRDAVLESIRSDLEQVGDVNAAKAYLRENLPKIEKIANRTLEAAGVDAQAVASLQKEAFDIRNYDTFSLPAGVYESLRIVIGEGEGKNWWCVAFPELCLSATSEDFRETAQMAGMNEGLTESLTQAEEYDIRFFLLDALGKLETRLESYPFFGTDSVV
ncbi:MAG TPA: stage II sporulation protein R [Clostridiales bacterium]|nr:stage II sporulation protein R [Clostridiales bacterium]